MSLSSHDIARRIRAKRFNERVKLTATTLNAIGLTVLGTAAVLPLVAGAVSHFAWIWILLAAGLHLTAQATLGRLRSED